MPLKWRASVEAAGRSLVPAGSVSTRREELQRNRVGVNSARILCGVIQGGIWVTQSRISRISRGRLWVYCCPKRNLFRYARRVQ
jgi:hypothetical protein